MTCRDFSRCFVNFTVNKTLTCAQVLIITELPTDPTVTERCTYILIDLDHILKSIVSLFTIKTTKKSRTV